MTQRNNTITSSDLDTLLKDEKRMQGYVDEAFRTEFFHTEPDVPLNFNGTQLIVRHVILSYLRQLLTMDKQRTPFNYIESEKEIRKVDTIDSHGTKLDILLGGTIDRIDSKQNESGREVTRILDYKTGGTPKAIGSIDELFQRDKERNGYVFQAFYYAYLMSDEYGCIAPSLLFMRNTSDDTFEPQIVVGEHPVEDFSIYRDQFGQLLHDTIDEIFNSDVPYSSAPLTSYGNPPKACKYCKFVSLCDREQKDSKY